MYRTPGEIFLDMLGMPGRGGHTGPAPRMRSRLNRLLEKPLA